MFLTYLRGAIHYITTKNSSRRQVEHKAEIYKFCPTPVRVFGLF